MDIVTLGDSGENFLRCAFLNFQLLGEVKRVLPEVDGPTCWST